MIVSYGTHPCCYVKIPKDHPVYEKGYDEPPVYYIECHGGITFAQNGYHPNCIQIEPKDGFWIGWDYNHYMDFSGLFPHENMKKWTTEEMYEEVQSVIKQLKAIKEGYTNE